LYDYHFICFFNLFVCFYLAAVQLLAITFLPCKSSPPAFLSVFSQSLTLPPPAASAGEARLGGAIGLYAYAVGYDM
jgi:hypothetical protein